MIEELFKYSEKEIPTVLNNNIYKSKFFTRKEEDVKINRIAFNVQRIRGRVFFDTIKHKNCEYSIKEFNYYYKPVTKECIKQLKVDNILNITSKWSFNTFFKFIAKKFVDYYGEERIDIKRSKKTVTIYYPEVIITNSVEMSHSMKDIYLTVFISDDYLYLSDIKRATYTISEINNNYIFSHVNTSNFYRGENSSFCFGSNNAVNTMMSNKMQGGRKSVLQNIGTFFPVLDEFLSWESLEGTPYYYIEKVINDENLFRKASLPSYYKHGLVSKIKETITDFNYSFSLTNNGLYKVELTHETITNISNILTAAFPTLSFLNKDGESVEYRNLKSNIDEYQGKKILKFKGENKYINILEADPSKNTLPTTIHTTILKDVINTLTKEFETYLINKKYGEI